PQAEAGGEEMWRTEQRHVRGVGGQNGRHTQGGMLRRCGEGSDPLACQGKSKEEERQMRKLSRLALGALFAGGLALPVSAEDGVTDTEIVLGSHSALSGPVSAWGVGSTEGMRMRFEEANEKGINGRKIKFIV